MPIKISVENNFLKVEGNDPERIYYERSRISHELFPTYVLLRYDNNKLAQLDLTTLDSTNTAFASLAAIVTFLTQVGDGDTGDGTVPAGGGGLTQAQAQAAFTAALQSQNQVEFQDILLEDANGVVYISTRQIDEETGAVTFTSRLPNGAAHTPIAPITTPKVKIPLRTDFWANIAGAGYSVGDRLERVITGSDIVWFNRTLETTLTTTPALANLVKAIGECFVSVNVSSVAHSADTPIASTTFTDSPAIAIPTIDGKKANTLYFYRTATTIASPLYPNDSGTLFGVYLGVPGNKVPLGNGAINRDVQFNISNVGSYVRLDKELTNIFIRNYNLSVSAFTFQFSYQEIVDNSQGLAYRALSSENNITAISTNLTVGIGIKSIILQIFCVGATTPVTFALEQTISLAGAGRQFTVQTMSLPAGTNTGQFQIPYKTRGGQFRIVPTGTFTNYSYRLIFNEANI